MNWRTFYIIKHKDRPFGQFNVAESKEIADADRLNRVMPHKWEIIKVQEVKND